MQIRHLYKAYGEKQVLRDLSFAFPTGLTLLCGASGTGKTTLLRLLCGLETPDSGEAEGAGRVSVLFQEDRLFSHLTARENVLLAGEKGVEYLMALGLGDSLDKLPQELSGGMNRRVALARALALSADTYLFDEPFKGLDAAARDAAFALIRTVTSGKTAVIITHEPLPLLPFADAQLTL